jgi:periplasmic protein CpxP/Spy
MKKTLLSFAIICFSAVLVNAQDMEKKEMTTQDRVVKQTDRLTKELGLSEDQAAKLFIINKEFGDQMEARREEKKADHDANRKETEAIRQAHNEKINALLTPEQQKKFMELQQVRKEKGKDKMHARPAKSE